MRCDTMVVVLALVAMAAMNVHGQGPAGDIQGPPAIVLGSSTVLSGPSSGIGREASLGMEVAVQRANAAGGVHGRPLRLIVQDDAYEPSRAVVNVRSLIDQHGAIAIVGNVGTPTAVATIPICRESGVVLFAPFTGAPLIRKQPPEPLVFHVRASYADEAEAIVAALLGAGLQPTDIAVFSQRDAYGASGYAAVQAALVRHGMSPGHRLQHVQYERHSMAVELSLANLITTDRLPRAVIMVGTSAPTAKFVKLAVAHRLDMLFVSLSFGDADALATHLQGVDVPLIVTQVVPHPVESELPIVCEYQQALRQYRPEAKPGFMSMEGYLSMRMLVDAMRAWPQPPTRLNLPSALEAMSAIPIDMEGPGLGWSRQDHEAGRQVWPTVLRDGRFVSMSWSEIASLLPLGSEP